MELSNQELSRCLIVKKVIQEHFEQEYKSLINSFHPPRRAIITFVNDFNNQQKKIQVLLLHKPSWFPIGLKEVGMIKVDISDDFNNARDPVNGRVIHTEEFSLKHIDVNTRSKVYMLITNCANKMRKRLDVVNLTI